MSFHRSIALLALLVAVAAAVSEDIQRRHLNDKVTCAKLLRLSPEHREQVLRSEYQENHDTYCFLRCMAVLDEMYDDEHGLAVDSLFERFNLGQTKEQFTEMMRACQEQNGDEQIECHCRKAYKPIMCFRKHYHEWRAAQVAES